MSECFIPIKGSAPRRITQKEFKLPVEESIRIIDDVRKIQKFSKTIRPDQHRKSYQTLLQWVTISLQSTKELVQTETTQSNQNSLEPTQLQTISQEVQMQQRRIIQTLMLQLTEMFKRECKEKSQLMQICFDYFNQLINTYTKHYQREFLDTLKNYNIELGEIEEDYGMKLAECNKRITFLQGEKQTKWKNIYMLAKDNRILRRQKGKLLRTIQEQDEKIRLLEKQLCQVVKENEMNKLIIRFENDSQNLQIFMKNRLALMKFQKIIEKYPKNAMKVLNNDLLKLQIEQLNSLDTKIDYIKRVIIESGDVFDEYEDLHELMTKPNKMVFNAFTQTDPEDIAPPKQFKQATTSYELQHTFNNFDTWEQIYDIKVAGWPEMREKFIAYRNPKKVATTKPFLAKKKVDSNQHKEFFLMQLCSKQVDKMININIKTKKKNNQFFVMLNTGVTFNPTLRNKTKLYFVMPYENRIKENEQFDESDLPLKQTTTKPLKQTQLRKSEVLSPKKLLANKLNKRNLTQIKTKKSQIGFSNEISQIADNFKENQIIEEQSEADTSVISEEDSMENLSFQSNDDAINQENESSFHPKFNKKKRLSKRGPEFSLFGMDKNSSTQKMSIFKEETVNNQSATRYSINTEISSLTIQKKNQRLSTEGSIRKNKRSQFILSKTSRIKTSQNEGNSRFSTLNKTKMDQIFQEPDDYDDCKKTFRWQSRDKVNRLSYIPFPKNFSKSKFFATMGNTNNFSNIVSKQNHMKEIGGILAERSQKYEINFTSRDSNIAGRKISKLSLRNGSFQTAKLKQRQSVNVETSSRSSTFSITNQQPFDYNAYFTESKPTESFEIIESEVLNPVLIRPLQARKLVQKIIRGMYTRRKQLLSSQTFTSLKVFIEHFLKQIYGNNWKRQKNLLRYTFTVEDRESSSSIKTFSIMLNKSVQIEYLQDLFRLYVMMLEKNEFSSAENPLLTSKTKGTAILRYILSVYFDQGTSNDIQQNLPFMNQFQIDLNDIFVVVETQIRKYTVQTEIYSFLMRFLPQNQSYIEFSQMKELLYFFKNEEKYHTHMARLKYFFKTYGKIVAQQQNTANKLVQTSSKNFTASSSAQKPFFSTRNNPKQQTKDESKQDLQILPIHRVCLYLKRYQWTDLIEINSSVEQRYYKMVGVFIQDEAIKFITKYCASLDESAKKKLNQSGLMNISVFQATPTTHQLPPHPLMWLLSRTKELIRNYYRYKGPLDRYFLMFAHISILMYELDLGVNEVISESLGMLNLECKKLRTKEDVDGFMKG